MEWFTGIVEDLADPKMLGRCRVRIHGIHSESKIPNLETGEGIETEALPWALPMQDITSAALKGIGKSPTGIAIGTIVVGFARDGSTFNDLIIMGTIAGSPEGGIHDVNEHARGISTEIVKKKKANIKSAVAKANGKGTWSEPATKFNAAYLQNHVYSTKNGILIELDDTDGAERVHVYHPSGTFIEMHPDGSLVSCVQGNKYDIIQKDDAVFIGGSININIANDCNIKANGNCDIESSGNTTLTTKDCIVNAAGNTSISTHNCDIEATGEANISSLSTVTIKGTSIILNGAKTVII